MLYFIRQVYPLFSRSERRRLALVFALMLGQSVLELLSIALVLPVIDIALTPSRLSHYPPLARLLDSAGLSEPGTAMMALGAGLVAAFIIKNIVLLFIFWLLHQTMQGLYLDFRTSLVTGYLKQQYARVLHQNSAAVIRNLFSSAAAIFSNGALGIFTVFLELMIIVSIGIGLVLIEPIGTAIAALIVFSTVGLYLLFTRTRIVTWGRESDWLVARMMQTMSEALGTFKEIKLGHVEPYFIEKFRRDAAETAAIRVKLAVNGVALRPVGEIVLVLAVVAIIGLLTILQGKTVAEIIPVLSVFAAAGIRIMPSSTRIVAGINNVREAMGPLENVLLDLRSFAKAPLVAEPDTSRGEFHFKHHLAVEGLSFRFDGAAQDALSEISLCIARGQSVAIIGRTGSGKTTLVDLILGLLTPSKGRVTIDGIDIQSNLSAWQRSTGYVPQTVNLIDNTLRRNIAFGRPDDQIDDDRLRQVIRIAQLEDFVRTLPDALDTMVGEKGVRISGGQRQRMGIARALYSDPDVLVMDEATSALDVLTEHQFNSAIEAIRGIKTILIIAHRLSTVRKCDCVFVLDHGRLVASGPFDKVVAEHPHLARMVELDQSTTA